MKKKLAFVSLNDHVPWGGSEVFWVGVVRSLIDKGGYHLGIAPRWWNKTPESIQFILDKGAEDFRRKPKKQQKSLIGKVLTKFGGRTRLQKNFDILDRYKPDLVFLSLGDHNNGWVWMLECKKRKIPYIIIVQLVKEAYCPVNKSIYQSLKEGYLNARAVLVTSNDNSQLLERQFGCRLKNLHLINNPINKLNPIPECKPVKIKQVALVSSLNVNHKGQDLLLELLRRDKWRKRDIHFNFYGEGPHEDLIRDLIDTWQIQNVTLHGKKPIQEIWKKNELLLMPSRMEGLSLALLEALWCNKPVVATNLGDASRFIENHINGFLVEAPTVKFLDIALENAWNCRDRWAEMGIASKSILTNEISDDPIESFSNKIDEFL